jgi:nonsense-mediated mRNA decay protein 3
MRITVEDVLNKKIKAKGKLLKFEIQPEGKKFFVYAKGYPKGSRKLKEERVLMPAHVNRIVCPNCSRRYCGYYEAIIQIRGNYDESVLKFVEDSVDEVTDKFEKGFITKVEKVVGGFDYYLGSKNLACKIAEQMKKKFNAEIKKSYKLVTEKDGQEIYRTNISVRI